MADILDRLFHEPSDEEILSNVQANIFEHHKRNHLRCLFFGFNEAKSAEAIAARLSQFASEGSVIKAEKVRIPKSSQSQAGWISTAGFQVLHTSAFKKELVQLQKEEVDDCFYSSEEYENLKKQLPCLTTLSLSFEGCQKLAGGLDEDHPLIPVDDRFKSGMSGVGNRQEWNEPQKRYWESNWRKFSWEAPRIDLLIMIADHSERKLEELTDSIKDFFEAAGLATLLFVEKGKMKKHDFGGKLGCRIVEPFGFRDGLSEIPFWEKYGKRFQKDTLNSVLDINLGSYLVYRKLEQDVALFNKNIDFIVSKLNEKDFQVERAFIEAQLMGRFKDGTPLALAGKPRISQEGHKGKWKGFDKFWSSEEDDPSREGFLGYAENKCPVFAHTRQSNPREVKDMKEPKGRGRVGPYKGLEGARIRIARRGIPYQEELKATYSNGISETRLVEGLQFMSYQANIGLQVGQIINKWCNASSFPEVGSGIDPIIGRGFPGRDTEYHFHTEWNSEKRVAIKVNFQDMVKLRGGGFFYTPSIKWIQTLPERVKKYSEWSE